MTSSPRKAATTRTRDMDLVPPKPLLTDLDNGPSEVGGLSKRARSFFGQDIFKGIPGLDEEADEGGMDEQQEFAKARGHIYEEEVEDEEEEEDAGSMPVAPGPTKTGAKKSRSEQQTGFEGDDGNIEAAIQLVGDDEDDWEEQDKRRTGGKAGECSLHEETLKMTRLTKLADIDIITAEAMTLAHSLATGEKKRYDVVDDGFNKHAFRDRDGLPDWFLDDESKHDKVQRPITKAAAVAIKEKLRAFNARPIRK